MLSNWLNFSFFDDNSTTSSGSFTADGSDVVVEKPGQHQQNVKQPSKTRDHYGSVSAATSPMSTYAGTPKLPLDNHTSFTDQATIPATGGPAATTTRRRRSSVFFKLPDLDKINNKSRDRDRHSNRGAEESADKTDQSVGLPARRLARSSFGRSSRRRASIVPAARVAAHTRVGSVAPVRALVNDIITTSTTTSPTAGAGSVENEKDHVQEERSSENGSREDDIGGDDGEQSAQERQAWRERPRGELLRGWGGHGAPVVPKGSSTEPPASGGLVGKERRPRTSPRALSEGHRRESFRDDTISRAPKELTAERLLADAQDVARIRTAAGLRATHQGVCWMASNWWVGRKKGVLSGRRYLVLCDNTIWAELRTAEEAEREKEGGNGEIERKHKDKGDMHDQGGFLPIISMDGAVVQHCEVSKSNNGWIIEVINAAADVTLWLDPASPTSLLKWGSVLCQALANVGASDEDGGFFPSVKEEGEGDLDEEVMVE